MYHVIRFSDLVDLWVIKIKPMIFCARREHKTQIKQREQAKGLFQYSIVKITRLYDYQTWRTHLLDEFIRCAKVCGLFLDCAFRMLIGWAGKL